jgi:hypothetical protein
MYIFNGGNQTVTESGSLTINNTADNFTMWGHGVVKYATSDGRSETFALRDQTAKADTLRLMQAVAGRNYTSGTISLYGYKEAP